MAVQKGDTDAFLGWGDTCPIGKGLWTLEHNKPLGGAGGIAKMWLHGVATGSMALASHSEYSIHNLNLHGFEHFSSLNCYLFFHKTCLYLLWSAAETGKQCFITIL